MKKSVMKVLTICVSCFISLLCSFSFVKAADNITSISYIDCNSRLFNMVFTDLPVSSRLEFVNSSHSANITGDFQNLTFYTSDIAFRFLPISSGKWQFDITFSSLSSSSNPNVQTSTSKNHISGIAWSRLSSVVVDNNNITLSFVDKSSLSYSTSDVQNNGNNYSYFLQGDGYTDTYIIVKTINIQFIF